MEAEGCMLSVGLAEVDGVELKLGRSVMLGLFEMLGGWLLVGLVVIEGCLL